MPKEGEGDFVQVVQAKEVSLGIKACWKSTKLGALISRWHYAQYSRSTLIRHKSMIAQTHSYNLLRVIVNKPLVCFIVLVDKEGAKCSSGSSPYTGLVILAAEPVPHDLENER